MIEQAVIKELDRAIESIRSYGETPQNKPAEYLLVEKNDCNMEDQIWHSVIEVQSISKKSKSRASYINDQVIQLLRNFCNENIAACELETSYSSTKTATKEYCFKAVFNITHYQED